MPAALCPAKDAGAESSTRKQRFEIQERVLKTAGVF